MRIALFDKCAYCAEDIKKASNEELEKMLQSDECYCSQMTLEEFQTAWNDGTINLSTIDTIIRFF